MRESETLDFGDGDEPVAPRGLSGLVADKITDRILRNEVRDVLDPLAASLAAERATDEQIEQLRESVKALRALKDDEESIVRENQIFHQLLGEACANPVLAAFIGAITRIFDGYTMGSGKYGSKEAGKIADFHAAIVDAVAARDATAAAETARNHIWDALRFFERRHSGLLDEPLRPTMLLGTSRKPAGRRSTG